MDESGKWYQITLLFDKHITTKKRTMANTDTLQQYRPPESKNMCQHAQYQMLYSFFQG
jgi:hypothetical protein